MYKTYMLDQEKKFTKTTITTARYCPLPKQLCQYWLFQKTSIQDRNHLTPLLKALFTAAEAALETDIHSAVVAAYAMGDRYSGQQYLKSASDELGVMTNGRIFRAIEELVPALHLEGKCENPDLYSDDPEYRVEGKRFLTIEYTRSSSTSGRRHKLDALLVFGEKALDGNFAAILRKVLDNSFSNGASISPVSIQDFSPDLAFAGSRAMAMFELRHKEWQRELAEEGRNEHGEL